MADQADAIIISNKEEKHREGTMEEGDLVRKGYTDLYRNMNSENSNV